MLAPASIADTSAAATSPAGQIRQIVLPYFVATVVVDHDDGATFLMPQHYGYRDGVGLGAFLEGLATYSVLGMRPKT
jgi:hypothetical protein